MGGLRLVSVVDNGVGRIDSVSVGRLRAGLAGPLRCVGAGVARQASGWLGGLVFVRADFQWVVRSVGAGARADVHESG